jgi:hypothetical protein
MIKTVVPYLELKTGICEDGTNHKVWLGFTGDTEPAFCSKCGKVARDVPTEEYEGF